MNRILIIVFFTMFFSCQEKQTYSGKMQKVLQESGKNKKELLSVLKHYKKDTLKLKAATFLIENMLGHAYSKSKLVDTTKEKVKFNVLDYKDYNSMVKAWDSVEQKIGKINFVRDTIIYDSQVIKADYLIKNIDLAFKSRNFPWAKKISFNTFCEYILPYRGSNEPLENWREYFIDKFSWLKDSLQDSTDPIEVAKFINSNLKSWYKFDARLYRHPTDMGLQEMLNTKLGRCEDMTNLAAYAMRANGIPVMTDYVTHWPTTGNNHAWNATYDKHGKVVIFMGALNNPGEYTLNNKKAKVYRKTYSIQDKSLSNTKPSYEKVPAWLRSKHNIDVTNEYVDVVTINPTIKISIPDSINFGYLAVFNTGKWEPTAWGKLNKNVKDVTFKNIGKEIVYSGVFYKKDSLLHFNQPFLVNTKGNLHYFIPDTIHKQSIKLYNTTKRAIIKTTDEIRKANFKPNTIYALYYWDYKWKLLDTQKANKDIPLYFKNAPKGALFWLKDINGKEEERIFSINDSKINWW